MALAITMTSTVIIVVMIHITTIIEIIITIIITMEDITMEDIITETVAIVETQEEIMVQEDDKKHLTQQDQIEVRQPQQHPLFFQALYVTLPQRQMLDPIENIKHK